MDAPADGTSSALMNSLFGPVEVDRAPDVNVFAEGSLLQQVPGLFDVLQTQDSSSQQPTKMDQGEGVGDSNGVRTFMEEVSRSFMRSGSISTGLVDQPLVQGNEGGGSSQGGALLAEDVPMPARSKELLDVLTAQMSAAATSGRDVSLEELIASGHVSAETLLNLIETLKAILPSDSSHGGGMSGQNLSALADILGLSQGESTVPANQDQGAMAKAEGLLGQLQQQQQQREQEQQQRLAYSGQQATGLGMGNSGFSTGTAPGRSNLGLSNSSGFVGTSGSTGGGGMGSSLGLSMSGVGAISRQPSSLRTRRGLPDLPVHRPSAGRAGAQPLSPLSGSATPSPRSGKRLANGALPPGLGWPLSPASKSPRADGQMSPAGSQLVGPSSLSLPNGSKYPPSPTTSLLGDLSKLAVHRPQTPPSGTLGSPGDHGLGGVKLEPGMLGQACADGEGRATEGGMEGGVEHYDLDELGDGDGAGAEDRAGDGAGEGSGGGSQGSAGRAKHSTKPRSVAERLRRERIAVRLQRLKEVMPKTDARIDTSAMLEDAVVYIRSLQSRCRALEKQNEMLTAQVARLSQQQQNGSLLHMNAMMRPMGQ